MGREDMVMARPKELRHLHIVRKVLDREMTQREASEIVSLSSRQIRRIVKRVRLEGDKGVIHRARGRPSNRRMSEEVRGKVIELYRLQYGDFGPTLASEKLAERDQIAVHHETLRLWLLESGDWKKRRRRRSHRRWRERKPRFGEMVQVDGSHHDWFEGRGPGCVLMGYIDDATGRVFARFYDYEGTFPAMESFRAYVNKYGLPMSVYLDQHSTYKSTGKPTLEEELNNTGPLSQFERALKELGVSVIHAHSAPAKGRVERLFGTLQDRLVKEMRLKGIGSVQEGNVFLTHYLPVYNRRFSVRAQQEQDLHRPLAKQLDLDSVLCIKTQRTLRNDSTITHKGKIYQIESRERTPRVMVQERINGSMKILYQGQVLPFREIPTRPVKEEPVPVRNRKRRRGYRPSADHPWRRSFKSGKHRHEMLQPQWASEGSLR